MKRIRNVAAWLISLVVLLAIPAVSQSFYNDRAAAVDPFTGNLRGISYGQVRVCTSSATGSPCTPLASNITDVNGVTLTVAGGQFGQVPTDVVGRWTMGCAPGIYKIQVAASASNTPSLEYKIACGAVGIDASTLVSSNNTFTGNNLFSGGTFGVTLKAVNGDQTIVNWDNALTTQVFVKIKGWNKTFSGTTHGGDVILESGDDSNGTNNGGPGDIILGIGSCASCSLKNGGRVRIRETGGTPSTMTFGTTGTDIALFNNDGNDLQISRPGKFGGAYTELVGNGDSPTFATLTYSILVGLATDFASLGTPQDGTEKYCNNCTNASNPCTGGGTGAIAKRLNGAWDCR